MPIISDKNKQKIKEQILLVLYENNLRPLFTSSIASELERDEEFILYLLNDLNSGGFVKKITKNSDGKIYLARKRWLLHPKVYKEYNRLSEIN